jgi:hypothetical protein
MPRETKVSETHF